MIEVFKIINNMYSTVLLYYHLLLQVLQEEILSSCLIGIFIMILENILFYLG